MREREGDVAAQFVELLVGLARNDRLHAEADAGTLDRAR